jgi:hypothetical protein
VQSKRLNVYVIVACHQNHRGFQAYFSSHYTWDWITQGISIQDLLHHHKPLHFPEKLAKILATTCHHSAQDCAMQAEAMAHQPPSLKDILSQVNALQGQLTALQQVNQNLQNQLSAIQNAPPQPADGAGAGAGVALPPPPSRWG